MCLSTVLLGSLKPLPGQHQTSMSLPPGCCRLKTRSYRRATAFSEAIPIIPTYPHTASEGWAPGPSPYSASPSKKNSPRMSWLLSRASLPSYQSPVPSNTFLGEDEGAQGGRRSAPEAVPPISLESFKRPISCFKRQEGFFPSLGRKNTTLPLIPNATALNY